MPRYAYKIGLPRGAIPPSIDDTSFKVANTIQLKASDGHQLNAYVAEPTGKPRGAVVVVQEIFGVNSHVRSVADGFAGDGYLAIAPAMFDRAQRG